MESFAQLAEADVSAIAPKVIARQIQRVAERARKARALVRVNRDLVGRAGRAIYLPKETGTISAAGISEGTEPSAQTVGIDTTLVSVSKIGARVDVTQEEIESVELDVINYKINRLGRAMALKEDADILDAMLATGAAKNTIAAASAGTLGYNDVVSAVNKVRAENYNPTILFIHPNQEADLLKDNRFIDASKYGAREPLLNGEIGKFAGCKVIVENYSALDNKPIVADPTEAGWLVIKRDVSVKRDELPISESIKIAAFAEYAVKVTQPAAVAHITLA